MQPGDGFPYGHGGAPAFSPGWGVAFPFEGGPFASEAAGSATQPSGGAPYDQPGGSKSYQAGLSPGTQPGSGFAIRLDVEPASGFLPYFFQPASSAGAVPQRGRLDADIPVPSQSAQLSALASGTLPNSQNVAVITGNATGSGAGGSAVAAPLAPGAGTLPTQPTSLSDSGGALSDRLVGSGAARQPVLIISASDSSLVPRLQAGVTTAATILHAALRPAVYPGARGDVGQPGEVPAPQGADLIADALPFDRATVVEALDQLVRQLGEVDMNDLLGHGPAPIAVFSLALLGSAACIEIARRCSQRRSLVGRAIPLGGPRGRDIPLGFPELPGSWSEKHT
jgi:hypothetical protein